MLDSPQISKEAFLKLANYRMPFGKYVNKLLVDIPEEYFIWFEKKGFPAGELGHYMAIMLEIKTNGLEYLFEPLKNKQPLKTEPIQKIRVRMKMKNNNESRRQFLSSSAAIAATTVLGTAVKPALAQEHQYVFAPPAVTSMEIAGSSERFPVRRVFCLGRNYRAHAIESGDNPDETPPFFFIKPRDAVIDSRDGFPYPPMTSELRYEGEMVVALKSGGANIREEDALDHVYAYGIGLDMTREDRQHEAQALSRPWAISKSFDKSAPCGPLYPVETHGHAVTGRIWLSVNGEIKQDSDLALQRWSVPQGIAILSQHYELAAGDIIMTGTPEGIGLVERGDVIRVGIDKLGEIEVRVI